MEETNEKSKDPILRDRVFCEKCEPEVVNLVNYVRQLENAQVVAKDALEVINLANAKLTKDIEYLQDRNDKLEKHLEGKERADLKKKMQDLDAKHQRFINRRKLG